MNVVFSSSNLYAKCTGIAIFSLLKSNVTLKTLNVFLITTDMTKENQKKIQDMCNTFNRNFTIIEANNILLNVQQELGFVNFKGGLNTYARAIADKVLPLTVDRALFVDSDLLIDDSLEKLEDLEMGDNIVAGVPEIMIMTKHVCYEDIELLDQCPNYLNYGVVLINLNNWRKFNGNQMIKKCISNYRKPFKIAEQSILNLTYKNHSMKLPVEYNFYTVLHSTPYKDLLKKYPRRIVFEESEIIKAQNHPIVIHFVGDYFVRPWYKNNLCKFKILYQSYYKESPWKDEMMDEEPSDFSILFKVYYKILIYLKKITLINYILN